MIRLVLSLISSLQIGARIQDVVERSVRRTVIVAIAAIILLFAFGFALVTAYQALIVYDFSPLAASAIVAGTLAVIGIVILLLAPALAKPKRKEPELVNAPRRRLGHDRPEPGQDHAEGGPPHPAGPRLRRRALGQPPPLAPPEAAGRADGQVLRASARAKDAGQRGRGVKSPGSVPFRRKT